MTKTAHYGLLMVLILILCVFLAGCSSQNTATTTKTVTTTQAGPKYSAGDIVAMTASSQSGVWLIISYDSSTDQYERAAIVKNSDGSWGHRTTTSTTEFSRVEMEKVYPVKLSHVSVTSVPVMTATVPTTVATTLSGSGPSITAISPTSGATGTSASITITGSNFQTGATARLVQPGKQPVTATSISVSSTQITGNFDLSSLAAGMANVEVINPDSRSASIMNAFTIGAASPVISSFSPTSASLGATSVSFSITGQKLS